MKRFVFRMESVLRVREFELERARVALGLLESEYAKRLSKVRIAEETLVSGHALLDAEMLGGVDGQRLGLRADGLVVGRLRLVSEQQALEELTKPLAEARRLVAHRRSRLRGLERLREQAQERHQKEGLAAEQRELEELALGRIMRTRSEAMRLAREGLE